MIWLVILKSLSGAGQLEAEDDDFARAVSLSLKVCIKYTIVVCSVFVAYDFNPCNLCVVDGRLLNKRRRCGKERKLRGFRNWALFKITQKSMIMKSLTVQRVVSGPELSQMK